MPKHIKSVLITKNQENKYVLFRKIEQFNLPCVIMVKGKLRGAGKTSVPDQDGWCC
jgi:2-phosphoglycerate kinase